MFTYFKTSATRFYFDENYAIEFLYKNLQKLYTKNVLTYFIMIKLCDFSLSDFYSI